MPVDFFVTNLYDRCLLNYVRSGHDRLQIVSGYASPRMLAKLIHERDALIGRVQDRFDINLLIGMTSVDGISATDLDSYRALAKAGTGVHVRVHLKPLETHSKVYVWSRRGNPAVAYVGSANFSQTGLGVAVTSRTETMASVDPWPAHEFADEQFRLGIPIHDVRVDVLKSIWTPRQPANRTARITHSQLPLSEVTLPLVTSRGAGRGLVPTRSGLNWGQRKGRDQNQAYIPVPSGIQTSGFFPRRGQVFTVTTPDGALFQMVRAQENGKAIHSIPSNADIGKYFRSRLGVPLGAAVATEDLLAFGTDGVSFQKFSDSAFKMQFTPSLGFNFQP